MVMIMMMIMIIIIMIMIMIAFLLLAVAIICVICNKFSSFHKYNPFRILYDAIYNYKCYNILATIIILLSLLLIKKLVTGNCFIVSMSMQEAILISFYGIITRVLVKSFIENLCKGYDYKISDLFKKFINKFKSKPVKSNTTIAGPGPSGVAGGMATGSAVASSSSSTSDRGTEELVVGQPVVQPVAQVQGQAEAQTESQAQPQDNDQNQDQNVDQPRMLTDLDREAMAGLRPASLSSQRIAEIQWDYRVHINDVYARRHKIFSEIFRLGDQIHYLREDEKKISDPDKKIEVSNAIKALDKKWMDQQLLRVQSDSELRDIEGISQLNPEYAGGTGSAGVESAKGSRAGSSTNSAADSEVDD